MREENKRRDFLYTTLALGVITVVSGMGVLPSCNEKKGEEKEVSPPEDLMQEHGVLNRILLIYDFCKGKLLSKESFPVTAVSDAATIIRTFVEDYHEKQEENYLFPRFQKANQLTDLIDVLLKQHRSGRKITEEIIQLTRQETRTDTENNRLIELLTSFNTMYRPHEAREDTVLFPSFRKLVSQNEYDSLGEEFENNEQRIFGKDGFETMVEKVSMIEKQLGIFELSQFTPQL